MVATAAEAFLALFAMDGLAIIINSSLKIGERTTSKSIDHVQVPFVSQDKDKEHQCETILCRVCGRK